MIKSIRRSNHISKMDMIIDLSLVILAFCSFLYSLKSSLMWVMLIAILVISGIDMIRHNAKMSAPLLLWYVYLLWSTMGVFYTNDVRYAGAFVVKLAILIISMSYYVKSDDVNVSFSAIKILSIIAIGTIVAEVFVPETISNIRNTLMVDTTMEEDIIMRLERFDSKYGIFSDPAVSAFFCASGFAVGICYWMMKNRKMSILYLGLSGWGAVLTNKRGPMMAIIISFILVIFICSAASYKRKIKAVIFVSILAVIAIVAYKNIPQIAEWLELINSNDASNSIRADIYDKLWDNFRQNMLLGIGTKSTRKFLEGYDAHNIYLAALSENGLPGLVMLVAALLLCFRKSIKIMTYFKKMKNRQLEIFTVYCIFGQMYFMLYGMTGNPMTDIYLLAFYFMCVGIPMRQYIRLSKIKGTGL